MTPLAYVAELMRMRKAVQTNRNRFKELSLKMDEALSCVHFLGSEINAALLREAHFLNALRQVCDIEQVSLDYAVMNWESCMTMRQLFTDPPSHLIVADSDDVMGTDLRTCRTVDELLCRMRERSDPCAAQYATELQLVAQWRSRKAERACVRTSVTV